MLSTDKPKLSPTDVRVVKAKVEAELMNNSQNVAAQRAFPNQTPASAAVSMTRSLKKANVQEALQEAMINAGISVESITGVVVDAMGATKYEKGAGEVTDHSIRLKAATIAARWMGAEKHGDGPNVNINFIASSRQDKDAYAL